MRFVQPVVMLAGAVIYVVCFVWAQQPITSDDVSGEAWFTATSALLIGWNVSLLAATVLAIVDSVRRIRAGKTR